MRRPISGRMALAKNDDEDDGKEGPAATAPPPKGDFVDALVGDMKKLLNIEVEEKDEKLNIEFEKKDEDEEEEVRL